MRMLGGFLRDSGETGELLWAFTCLRYMMKLRIKMNLRFRMNLQPKLNRLQCLSGLFRPLFIQKMNRPLLDLSASPQIKNLVNKA